MAHIKNLKKPIYFTTILMAIIAIGLICFFYTTSAFFVKYTPKSNVFLNFKTDSKKKYGIFLNDSLIITSSQIRKLKPEDFYKQTRLDFHLKSGDYIIEIKDSFNQIMARENFSVVDDEEKYFYLYTNEIEIRNQPYLLI